MKPLLLKTLGFLLLLTGCSGGYSGEIQDLSAINGSESGDTSSDTGNSSNTGGLSFESDGWECKPYDGWGTCSNFTYEGAHESDSVSSPAYAALQFICFENSSQSEVYAYGANSLRDDSTRFLFNPDAYPTFSYSIDGDSRKTSNYDIIANTGNVIPDSINLLDEWPEIMRDLAGANTLQIWLNDSDGVGRQLDMSVEGNVSAVATLAAWGFSCTF